MIDPNGGAASPFCDPQRLFTPAQRAEIAARQHHVCAHCPSPLVDGEWDAHHVVRHTDGGPSRTFNGVGLCKPCHRVVEVVDGGFEPRLWQAEARDGIYNVLRRWRFATLNAAPGAGKTQFAGWIFRHLAEAREVERLVVMVPYRHLCTQWAESLADTFGIYLANNLAAERRGEHGVVLTYQGAPQKLEQLVADASETPTLVVLDEVHHLGFDERGAAAWGHAVGQLVGDYHNPKMPVLNLTGTLFRSKKQERISTVDYVSAGHGAIESKADYTIPAAQLIKDGVLRYIRLLGFDQDMAVHGIELETAAHKGAANMRAIDLDKLGKRQRTSVINTLIRNDDYIDGMMRQTIEELTGATIALGGKSIKGLVIADDVAHARQIHARLRELGHGASAFIAVGEDGQEADLTIDLFRKQTKPAILVAVQKVTEGFDVPDVGVLTYLKTWSAPLFINQMAGRVMRVTTIERETGQRLPATILIPDDREIRAAFADVLVGSMRLLEAPKESCASCGREICACPIYRRLYDKECGRCHQPDRWCVCNCRFCHQPRRPQCSCPPGTCWACGEIPCACNHRGHIDDVTVELTGEIENTSSTVNGREISNLLMRDHYKTKLLAHGKNPADADLLVAVIEEGKEEQPWLAGADPKDPT